MLTNQSNESMDGMNTRSVYKKNTDFSLIIKVIILIIISLFIYVFFIKKESLKPNTADINSPKNAKIIAKVSKLVLLPTDEKPSIILIDNAEVLSKQQPFFKDVNNDDLVLIYAQNAKAFIYRPDANILIHSGPIFRTDENQEKTTTTNTTKTETVKTSSSTATSTKKATTTKK